MRIVIVGPGALGCLLAAKLSLLEAATGASGGHSVYRSLWLLDHRPPRAAFLATHGIVLEQEGRSQRCPVRVSADPTALAGSDVIFLCVKAPVLAAALASTLGLWDQNSLVIGVQNGISHLEILARTGAVPLVAVTSEGATMLGPGHVRHGGRGVTRIGPLAPVPPQCQPLLTTVVALLNQAGFQTELTATPLPYLWAKLFINVGINALSAIHDLPNGALLEVPAIRDLMTRAVQEAHAVARACNIPIFQDPVAATFQVCRATAHNISSMLQDVRHQRRTEIEAINGAIVAEGLRRAIPTPVNRELVARVKQLEANYAISPANIRE